MRVVYIINNGDWSILCFLFNCGCVDGRGRVMVEEKLGTQINHQMQCFTNLKSAGCDSLLSPRVHILSYEIEFNLKINEEKFYCRTMLLL